MFADDTQLLSKNEESVEQSFLILSKFEKASGSKINYEKTKGLSVDYFVYKFYLFTFDKIVYVNHSHPPFITI
jgi:hypothetical protein